MHHLLEIALWLLLALLAGWFLGWLLRCLLAREEQWETGAGMGYLKPAGGAAALQAARAADEGTASSTTQGLMAASGTAAAAAAGTAQRQALSETSPSSGAEKAARESSAADGKVEEASARRAQQDDVDEKHAAASAGDADAAGDGVAAADADKGDAAAAEKLPAHGLSGPIAGEPDDLQLISGIGPKLEKLLHDMGIYYYRQIAAWTKKDIAEVDAKLKFKGRIERDEWVRQAKLLAAGKLEQFEREYGTGGKKGADGKTRSGTRTRRKSRKKS